MGHALHTLPPRPPLIRFPCPPPSVAPRPPRPPPNVAPRSPPSVVPRCPLPAKCCSPLPPPSPPLTRLLSPVRLQVGYCQGMAFCAGILLMYLPEEPAFRYECMTRCQSPSCPHPALCGHHPAHVPARGAGIQVRPGVTMPASPLAFQGRPFRCDPMPTCPHTWIHPDPSLGFAIPAPPLPHHQREAATKGDRDSSHRVPPP